MSVFTSDSRGLINLVCRLDKSFFYILDNTCVRTSLGKAIERASLASGWSGAVVSIRACGALDSGANPDSDLYSFEAN